MHMQFSETVLDSARLRCALVDTDLHHHHSLTGCMAGTPRAQVTSEYLTQ